ncbi:MAG: HepT-like ribonuclease domain-containing protein [Phormidesmis sp.]
MNRDKSYLLDLYKAACDAQAVVAGLTAEAFVEDRKAQLAMLYSIVLLGEVVKRLSPEFRTQHSAVRWRQIVGMRDKLIHDYKEVDILLIWQASQQDIPELIKYIQPLLPKK